MADGRTTRTRPPIPKRPIRNSTALVTRALLALGQSPSSPTFDQGANTPLTTLLSFQVTSGSDAGAFFYPGTGTTSTGNIVATNQVIPALAGLTLPISRQQRRGIWYLGLHRHRWRVPLRQRRLARGFAASVSLDAPIVGSAATPDGAGYWLVASDGGIFATATRPPRSPAASPSTSRSWAWRPRRRRRLLAGGVGRRDLQLRRRHFYGSPGGPRLNEPIVGMAATPDGGGYWLVASDGGIFSSATHRSTVPPAASAERADRRHGVHPNGGGYWLVASDGGIFSYGDAGFFGSTGSIVLNRADRRHNSSTPDGDGYWLVASDGGIFNFGDAAFSGSAVSNNISERCGCRNEPRPRSAPRGMQGPGAHVGELLRRGCGSARPQPGPGPSCHSKFAIASADSVGNDVYVTVVVDFGNGSSMSTVSKCVPVASSADDADALAAAVGSGNVAYANSGLLCAIADYPADGVQNCGEGVGWGDYDYWSYWHGSSGSWVSGERRARQNSRCPAQLTTLKGWRFQLNEPDNLSDPSPAVTPSYSQICNASTEVPPAQSPSGPGPPRPRLRRPASTPTTAGTTPRTWCGRDAHDSGGAHGPSRAIRRRPP